MSLPGPTWSLKCFFFREKNLCKNIETRNASISIRVRKWQLEQRSMIREVHTTFVLSCFRRFDCTTYGKSINCDGSQQSAGKEEEGSWIWVNEWPKIFYLRLWNEETSSPEWTRESGFRLLAWLHAFDARISFSFFRFFFFSHRQRKFIVLHKNSFRFVRKSHRSSSRRRKQSLNVRMCVTSSSTFSVYF